VHFLCLFCVIISQCTAQITSISQQPGFDPGTFRKAV